MGSARFLTVATEPKIWPKFYENAFWHKGDMELTWNEGLKLMTFNCDLDLEPAGWVMSYVYHFTAANIWPKFNKNPSRGKGDLEKHKIEWSNWQPSTVTLVYDWMVGSAHNFTEANSWTKINEYLSSGKEDMEGTQNSKLKLVTFNYDLDLELAWLRYGFHTLPH